MSELTVRPLRFSFDAVDFDLPDDELTPMLISLGVSLTMPYLEPYLIRTMKVALKEVHDPALAEDVRRFSQQEAHHFQNHAAFNEELRSMFDPANADAILAIESALEADYQRFSKEESLRFNVAYAEGFEAMTCAAALANAEHGALSTTRTPGGEFWAWHVAEEIEHRRVCFELFEHLDGSYWYRMWMGTWSQGHYVGYIRRFMHCIAAALGRHTVIPRGPIERAGLRRYLRTWSPWYHPKDIEIPRGVDRLLRRYSAMAAEAQDGVG